MKERTFEDLYDQDYGGEELVWEWDESDRVFRATDSKMKTYMLRPTQGVIEIEELDEEMEEDEE